MEKRIKTKKENKEPVTLIDNEMYTIVCKDQGHAVFAALDLVEMGLQNIQTTFNLIEDKNRKREILQNFSNLLNKVTFEINK